MIRSSPTPLLLRITASRRPGKQLQRLFIVWCTRTELSLPKLAALWISIALAWVSFFAALTCQVLA